MANPQFSTNRTYPITVKPLTSPENKQTHEDLFNIFNSFRMLFQDLDREFGDRVEEAPQDGKMYARKDGAWVEIP